MADVNPVIATIAPLECPWCGSRFEDKLLRFDMAFMGRTVNLPANPLCPACRQLAAQKRAAEEVARQQQREAEWARLCPAKYRLTTEADGETDLDHLRRLVPILDELVDWANTDRKRGLLLRGPTGMGKSRAMFRVVRRLWERGISCQVWTPARFEAECQAARDNHQLGPWMDRQISARGWFIDDLIKMRWLPTTEGVFFDIVEARTRDQRPILVTTNDPGAVLEKRFSENVGPPLVRRLREHCDCFVFEQGK
ncbi:MAG: hypothetical protein L0Y58_23140 [Verrucomicrobia subdivision 3 bacterium]|nr:hypothetical protein [Limisphaerales bacterium]